MMKHRLTRFFCSVFLGVLLLSSCATIISTPYQTIRVAGQPAGSTIYVNNQVATTKPVAGKPDAVRVRVSRKKNAEIKVSHEGYKEYTEIIMPTKINPVAFLNYGFVALSGIGLAMSLSAISHTNYNTGYRPSQTSANTLLYGGLGITLLGPLLDVITGASKKFPKNEIRPLMLRRPTVVGSQTVQAGPMSVRFKGGEKMGNLYVNREVSEMLYFGKSLNLDADDLRKTVNHTLQDLGYSVPGTEGRSVFGGAASSRYTVQADVRDLKYDIHQTTSVNPYAGTRAGAYGGMRLVQLSSHYETTCIVEVTWKLLNQAHQPVAETKTSGTSVRFEEGGSAAFEDAFENALYTFLALPEAAAALTAKGHVPALPDSAIATATPAAPANSLAPITLHRPALAKPAPENGLPAAARNVVTVETADGHGSGCLVSPDGYLVTNAHVVSEASTVKVQLADGITTTGRVVRVNTDMDLALVKIAVDGLAGFRLPTAATAEVGADVYAIGTPADKELGQSITKGIISGRRKIEGHAYLQTDVSISGGNSGGALVTRAGELLGLVNAKLVGQGVEGIGFAIPAEVVSEALQLKFID